MIADNEERYSYLLRMLQELLDIKFQVFKMKAMVEPMNFETKLREQNKATKSYNFVVLCFRFSLDRADKAVLYLRTHVCFNENKIVVDLEISLCQLQYQVAFSFNYEEQLYIYI